MKIKMDQLVKENRKRSDEIKKLKEENDKITTEIGQLHYNKDKGESERKAKEKVDKIKENTKLFNRIIENDLKDGKIKNVDINKYKKTGRNYGRM